MSCLMRRAPLGFWWIEVSAKLDIKWRQRRIRSRITFRCFSLAVLTIGRRCCTPGECRSIPVSWRTTRRRWCRRRQWSWRRSEAGELRS
ncbi:hypothetical protein LINGRAHAP2_LOCUS24474 [Linum grandiflorum]